MDMLSDLGKIFFNFQFLALFLLWISWLLYASKKIDFWIWLLQLKEYRRDRIKAHFQLKSSKKIFFNNIFFLKIILFFLFFFFIFFEQKNQVIFFGAAGAYFLLVLAAIIFGSRKTRKAVQTQKARLLRLLSILFFILVFPLCFLAPQKIFYLICLLAFSLFDIILPGIVFFFLGIITPFSDFQKNRIIEKAKKKIKTHKDNLLVIGVTGSYGKTSTKEFLSAILSLKFKVLKTDANNNTEMGVAKTILEKLDRSHEVFIVEMAAYKKGEIKNICEMVSPTVGIITGIGNQHLGLFGSPEKIINAKYELIESLPDKGLAVFNGDSNFFMEVFKKTKKPKKFYSLSNFQADVFAKEIWEFKDRVEFKIHDRSEELDFRVSLLGREVISNILGACLVAKEMGMKFSEMKDAIQAFRPFLRTMELKPGINGIVIIDDSYSGNFEGVISALNYLRNYKESKKVIVLYPIIELGSISRDIHKKIGKRIGEICDLCILVSDDFSKEIKDGAILSGMDSQRIRVVKSPRQVIKQVKDFARRGDIVLLENRVPSEIIKALIEN